jgi:hypothetical protein
MRLNKLLAEILEGICGRMDGESDNDFLQRCGNALMKTPDYIDKMPEPYSDKIRLQTKQISKAQPPSPFDTSVRDSDPNSKERHLDYHDDEEDKKKSIKEKNEMGILGMDLDTSDNPTSSISRAQSGNTDVDSEEEDMVKWMTRKTQEILDKYTENRFKGLSKEDKRLVPPITQVDLRPEPHPTRHETEHPPYEKSAMQNKNQKFQPPNKKIMQVRGVSNHM